MTVMSIKSLPGSWCLIFKVTPVTTHSWYMIDESNEWINYKNTEQTHFFMFVLIVMK